MLGSLYPELQSPIIFKCTDPKFPEALLEFEQRTIEQKQMKIGVRSPLFLLSFFFFKIFILLFLIVSVNVEGNSESLTVAGRYCT